MAEVIEHHVDATLDGRTPTIEVETGRHHRIVVHRPVVHRPAEPLGCATGSGLVLPGPWTKDRHPIPFLLSAVHEAARLEHPVVLVVGHAGAEESPDLAQARAKGLQCLVDDDVKTWVRLATETGSIEDVKGYLQYLNATLGWECHVEVVDRSVDAATAASVEAFQREFNTTFDRDILVDGVCGEETLGALFEVLRFEWNKWLHKHAVDQDRIDGLELLFVDAANVPPSSPGLEGMRGNGCVDLLVFERSDLGQSEATAATIYGSGFTRFARYEIPLEPWAWERGPYTIVTDLIAGEVVPRETYTLRSTDGDIELSQSIPVDAIDMGLLELRFFALPCDKAYDLTVTVNDSQTYVLFEGVPYNQLHRLATQGEIDG